MIITDFLKCNVSKSINTYIKSRPRPKRILDRPLDKYNLTSNQIDQLKRQGFLTKMDKRVRSSVINPSINPPNEIEITFLGTSAGKPTISRNPSSLAVRMDGNIWMFDCGEATTHQMMRTNLKPSNVSKIFITHLHGDHVLGLISFLSHIGDRIDADLASKNQHPFCDPSSVVEIFGPSGIREFVRSNLRLTKTHSMLKVKVNELLRKSKDNIFGPSLSQPAGGPSRLWHHEVLGKDIWCDSSGLWKDVIEINECGVSVSAAPIQHTIDCVGYLITEANRRENFDMSKLKPILEEHESEIKQMGFKVLPAILSQLEKNRKPIVFSTGVKIEPPKLSIRGRRIMILGDTCDPTPMISLLDQKVNDDTPIDLLIHESTGTSVPDSNDLKQKTIPSESQVATKMRERGHSTSFMAGKFAHRVRALRLVLNHLGGKFPAPQGNICPSEIFSRSLNLPEGFPSSSTTTSLFKENHHSGLKANHAELWKKFEELDQPKQAKILGELEWLKAVENDALLGWKFSSDNLTTTSTTNRSHQAIDLNLTSNLNSSIQAQPSNLSLNLDCLLSHVSVAYDFLQIKLPRTDQ